MDVEIWEDLRVRLSNLRGDMVGQWQGDLPNSNIEGTIMLLGHALRTWQDAKPEPPQTPPV